MRALYDPALQVRAALSWLEFTRRVVNQAEEDSHPRPEQVKFFFNA